MTAYLRATTSSSGSTATRGLKLARLFDAFPPVGEAVGSGRVGVDHALEIARIHVNPRIAEMLPAVVDVLVDLAELRSHRELRDEIDQLIGLLDQDGAFDDLAGAIESRRASVVESGGTLHVSADGGDATLAAQLAAVHDQFVDAEYRADVAARRERFGDDAEYQHPLRRTPAQRRFDALVAIFAAASASPEGRALPDTVVNVLVDDHRVHETLTHAGIILPNGKTLDLDDGALDPTSLVSDLAAQLAADPETFLRRRCETSSGSAVHPSVLLRSLLTGHVRRVVVDSQGLVIDYGTKRRLFTGSARRAALLLAATCEHPGCELPGRWSQIDHSHEWSAGGRTDQSNVAIRCGHHNRHKHRTRSRTRRERC